MLAGSIVARILQTMVPSYKESVTLYSIGGWGEGRKGLWGYLQFAAKGIGDQEDGSASATSLSRDAKLFAHAKEAVGVERGVEVHGTLDEEDDDENLPLLPSWEGVAKNFRAVGFCEDGLATGSSCSSGGLLG